MLFSDVLANLSRATYLIIGLLTMIDFLRHRDRARLDIALVFLFPAINVLTQLYALFIGPEPALLVYLGALSLMAQPYMLLRLVAHFRPVARPILLASDVAFALSVVLLTIPGLISSPPVILFLVGYYAWAEGYSALAFVRGAVVTAGVSRWRYWLAAAGAVLFGTVIVAAGLLSFAPAAAPYVQPVTQLLGTLSGLAFYLAFAPPRWLRQGWQSAELHRYLQLASGPSPRQRADRVLPLLCDTTTRAVGARGALVALATGEPATFQIQESTLPGLRAQTLLLTPGPLFTAWQDQRPVVANQRAEVGAPGRHLLDAVGAQALCAVPLSASERHWGLLVALLQRRPLFPDDDLELMRLFSEQAAGTLDQKALLDEQDALIQNLRDQTVRLEAANQELEAFSYSVSHDLRAPLRHIEGFTDLLLRTDPGEAQRRQHLERISGAAVRMGALIDSLLTFSRMGRTELRCLPVALDRLVAEAQHELSADAPGREVVWHIDPLPEVMGDPDLLRQVLVNLLSNALKYSRDRHPAQLAVGVEAQTDSEVVIFVRDNGVGFDMQYGDKLFGVFQRLHHAHEFEGIGIGLANVRRIVHRHGGRTWAVGAVGVGATFYFSLPLFGVRPAAPLPNPLPAVPAPYASLPAGALAPRD